MNEKKRDTFQEKNGPSSLFKTEANPEMIIFNRDKRAIFLADLNNVKDFSFEGRELYGGNHFVRRLYSILPVEP